jgi:hypothetical protein
MRLEFLDGYYIENDTYCWILKRDWIGKDKSGQPKNMTKVVGYFGTIKQALHRCTENEIIATSDTETVCENIMRINKRIDELPAAWGRFIENIAKELNKSKQEEGDTE